MSIAPTNAEAKTPAAPASASNAGNNAEEKQDSILDRKLKKILELDLDADEEMTEVINIDFLDDLT